ncbi:PQQ-dependent sugar dehydrogenase [Ferrimonas pelagia]|uniref:Sorbosone dehydrogenase family protein n=1 Tax=Ferrimonas pelagia TaxID=1177826 RepID=A0ABP9EL60_9GAMM
MRRGIFASALAGFAASLALPLMAAVPAVEQAQLPPGFLLELYIDEVPNARQMAWGDQGTLFVGSRREGKVHAVLDSNNDGHPDRVTVLASDLTLPSGLAFQDGTLYVGAVSQILAFPAVETHLRDHPEVQPEPQSVYDRLPQDRHHGWKYLAFAPDGRLIVPVGAPCNNCEPDEPYATILALDLASGEREILARGVRNTVGFDLHPDSGELYFSDNGRDMMGDDVPPDEINRLTVPGSHFGYPYWHGGAVADPEFALPNELKGTLIDPIARLPAHVAPLGVHFYRGKQFPELWQGALLIAEHGSWNRSSKVGYRITALTDPTGAQGLDNSGYRVLIDGWLDGDTPLARPAAILPHPDGSILISDDYHGRIYRLSYTDDTGSTKKREP